MPLCPRPLASRATRSARTALVTGIAALGLAAGAFIPSPATGAQGPAQRPSEATQTTDPAHTDVLFIGAHPDDEYQSLAAFGQWNERDGLSTGVVTITRGEGGGNAKGPQEGAELGLMRETEERSAVRPIGIDNVFYLDKPDFWYTLSASLTTRVWDGPPRQPDTLERLVRLIRATTPKTVVTMDPRPFNQHGGHQLAGRLAIEAFQKAGDRNQFPRQIDDEHYQPWQPSRLLAQNWGFKGPVGPGCATTDVAENDPDTGLPQQGVWEGEWSAKHGTTWAQQERNAARKYVTQGFGSLPAEITTPRDELPCDWFSVLAEDGKPVPAPVHEQQELRPLFADFRDWTRKVGMPWLAHNAQPGYPNAPTTTIPAAARQPKVDGEASPGEYPGKELKLVHWQDKECASPADCSAVAHLSRHGDDLYVLVEVTDNEKGAALRESDCKRHGRTDSVEIGLDPPGNSDDTSTTFKTGILPFTARGGGACAARDADHHQGSAEETAPGMEVASQVRDPYTGYTVEAKIPLIGLPDTVDPQAMTANIMLYDSDTTDKVGKTRLAWSPFGSAQADPYVWGRARLDGYTPPIGQPLAGDPVIPLEAAKSSTSHASVDQCRRTGVPLAAGPRLGKPCDTQGQ